MIKIDGSSGEGGGQIIRTALTLAAVTDTPVKITNIRIKRPRPGLAQQHLKGVEFLKKITDAEVEGLKLASKELLFTPHGIKGGRFEVDIRTAGSISLFLQSIIPAALTSFEKLEIRIRGGTDVKWAPPIDFLRFLLLPILREMGADIKIELLKRGYYPKGGGLVKVTINPSKLSGIRPEACDPGVVSGISHASNLPRHVVERQAKSASERLFESGTDAIIDLETSRELSTGSGILLHTGYKSGSSLGERGKRAELVGVDAAENLLAELGAGSTVDIYLADQLIPFMALADGRSEIRVREMTGHLRTNIAVVEAFLGRIFEIKERDGIITIQKP